MGKIAVIRIKGQVNMKKEIKDTLDMLRLYRKNYCTIIENKPETMGMVTKAKDYVAWGEVSEDLIAKLPKSRFFKLEYIKNLAPLKKARKKSVGNKKVASILAGALKALK